MRPLPESHNVHDRQRQSMLCQPDALCNIESRRGQHSHQSTRPSRSTSKAMQCASQVFTIRALRYDDITGFNKLTMQKEARDGSISPCGEASHRDAIREV